ncbi:hypothetical protein BU23DRAFT_664360 [Bimuria novae-zelandiae CBS 107.79]|uniref:Knr4/Smi1-like domain-containing protein n=1 Tax=Bimuria novae-zelandiae CBS 107.79 TaxID=1447943 RepID=A0A6A5UM26_9PLEO|nr:hypothetical protein BU23DRAFT_664360 [Bimuria novae-zelandiae CBS 107.79]
MSYKTKFDKDDILRDPYLPVIYERIREMAKELAVLGKIDIASRITDLLLSQNRTEHGFSLMQFLNFAFEQTGDWPSAIPQSARSKDALDELEIPPSGSMDEKRYDELINPTESSQRDPGLCLTIAVVLCEKRGKTDLEEIKQDERVVRALEQITERFHAYFGALIQHRKIWPLLASGVIAQQVGVDNAKLCATAEDLVETIRVRLEEGRQMADHEGKPIKELLEILVENTRKHACPLYEELHEDPPESYLHKPATEKDIKDMEKRLKMSPLPDDHKEFLLASNNVVLDDLSSTVEKVGLELVEDLTGTPQLIREAGCEAWPSATKHIGIAPIDAMVYVLIGPSDVKATIKAYKKALASDKVTDAMKAETTRAIEDRYGSMEAFEKMEWAMIYGSDYVADCPVGTFRSWLEDIVRTSGKLYDSNSGNSCLAYECRAEHARRG